jgi:hypothetical protein
MVICDEGTMYGWVTIADVISDVGSVGLLVTDGMSQHL